MLDLLLVLVSPLFWCWGWGSLAAAKGKMTAPPVLLLSVLLWGVVLAAKGKMTVEALEKMLEDPTIQQMILPYASPTTHLFAPLPLPLPRRGVSLPPSSAH